jgi:iron-sulfur cluster insertion protein
MCDKAIDSPSGLATIEAPAIPDQLILTDAAVAKVGELIAEGGNPDLKLRVYVNGGGCSGFQYGFAFDDCVNDDDYRVDKEGITLLIDAMSMQYLTGAEIGYEDGLEGSRFVIKNPNASTSCGCGSSFSV